MASQFVYWTSDGGGRDGGERAAIMHQWILAQQNASLIVYGGDVYDRGQRSEYDLFFSQMGSDLSLMCETSGNHDWMNRTSDHADAVPRAYEEFWSKFPPPHSRQPVDQNKVAGARYEHVIDMNGWRLIFVDSGALEYENAWPMGNNDRVTWLNSAVTGVPGRAKILLSHYSRLSWGMHGDNAGMSKVWEALFDQAGNPLAACTISGHDHNVSLYEFRDKALAKTDATHGIQMWVNGAGGAGPYARNKGTHTDMIYPKSSSPQDDPVQYAVTKIELVDDKNAIVSLLSFGSTFDATTQPKVLLTQEYHV